MKLTGKAKEQFDNWLTSAYQASEHAQAFKALNLFYKMPNSMQWGAYQDWADSIKVVVDVETNFVLPTKENRGCIAYVNGLPVGSRNTTRQEARNAAIEKLNELINQKQIR